MTITTLRANFRIEKKKTSRMKWHWQMFCHGLWLCYTSPFILNLLTGLTCVILAASISLLQQLPYESYFSNAPRIIILLDYLGIDEIQQLENRIATHHTIKTIQYIAPQEGFKRFIANFYHQDNAFINLKNATLDKAKELPHVFEITPHITCLLSAPLTALLKELKSIKGVTHIQLDKAVFKAAYHQYIQYRKRITRLIGLFFIIGILLMCHHFYRMLDTYLTNLPLLLYHTLWLTFLLSVICSLGLNQTKQFLTTLFLLPPLSFSITLQKAYPIVLWNIGLIISISLLLGCFFKWQARKCIR